MKPVDQKETEDYVQRSHARYLPYRLMLSFALLGLGMLFIVLMFSFLFSERSEPVPFPKLFILSTLLIGISSLAMEKAKKAFREEKRKYYNQSILTALITGLLFVGSQLASWLVLKSHGILLDTYVSASYLYLITGLHAVHLFVGIGILLVFVVSTLRYTTHEGTALYYFTDPARLLHLDLIRIYWHFLAAMWGLIVLFFLLGSSLL